jgi:hypothetical protein
VSSNYDMMSKHAAGGKIRGLCVKVNRGGNLEGRDGGLGGNIVVEGEVTILLHVSMWSPTKIYCLDWVIHR